MTSASPARSSRSASPIACAPEAHAETVQKFGPLSPNWIDTWPAAMSEIIIGMKNGLTRRRPFWSSARVLRLERFHAADARPDDDADAVAIGTRSRSSPDVLQRLVRRHDRELDEAIHPLRVLAVEHALGA